MCTGHLIDVYILVMCRWKLGHVVVGFLRFQGCIKFLLPVLGCSIIPQLVGSYKTVFFEVRYFLTINTGVKHLPLIIWLYDIHRTFLPMKVFCLLLKYIQSNMESKSKWIDMIPFLCQSYKCSWMLFVNNIIKKSCRIERSLYKRCFIQGRMQYIYVANPVYAWENT